MSWILVFIWSTPSSFLHQKASWITQICVRLLLLTSCLFIHFEILILKYRKHTQKDQANNIIYFISGIILISQKLQLFFLHCLKLFPLRSAVTAEGWWKVLLSWRNSALHIGHCNCTELREFRIVYVQQLG